MKKSDLLLTLLSSPESSLREIYLKSITADEPSSALLSHLVQLAVTDPSGGVRREAILALARHARHEPVLTMLREIVMTAGPQEAACVAEALATVDTAEVEPILEETLARRPEFRVRIAAVTALASRPTERTTPLLSRTARDPDEFVRAVAVTGLGRTGDPSVVPILDEALADADPRVRANALEALGRFRDSVGPRPFVGALSDPSHRVRLVAIRFLVKMGLADLETHLAGLAGSGISLGPSTGSGPVLANRPVPS